MSYLVRELNMNVQTSYRSKSAEVGGRRRGHNQWIWEPSGPAKEKVVKKLISEACKSSAKHLVMSLGFLLVSRVSSLKEELETEERKQVQPRICQQVCVCVSPQPASISCREQWLCFTLPSKSHSCALLPTVTRNSAG